MTRKSPYPKERKPALLPTPYLDGKVIMYPGDCLDVLDGMDENSVDSVVCDPPYHLHSIVKRFAKTGRTESTRTKSGPHQRTATGFMGKKWDGGDVAFRSSTWAKVLRVLKPGGYLVAFSSSRTFGRMSVAIEDAGFINHPLFGWIFGSGFPKAHRVHAEGYEGWRYGGQASKPALEPIYMGQKPFIEKTGTLNVLRWGTGALNIDGCRIEAAAGDYDHPGNDLDHTRRHDPDWRMPMQQAKPNELGRWPANIIHDGSDEVLAAFPEAPGQQADASSSSSRKTQHVYGAMKRGNGRDGEASSDRRYADEGATNFAALPGQQRGDEGSAARFFKSAPLTEDDLQWNSEPANSAESFLSLQSESAVFALTRAVDRSTPGLALRPLSYRAPSMSVTERELSAACSLVTRAIQTIESEFSRGSLPRKLSLTNSHVGVAVAHAQTDTMTITISHWRYDGSAAPVTFDCTVTNSELGAQDSGKRFHYTSKADADDRLGSKHPTVKPIDLMQYLVRLVTPLGGTVLDPFAGTGTTGEAAWREGMRAVLIEREPEYQADIARRMELAENPTKRAAVAKSKNNLQGAEGTPLFGGVA